jgi:hypothetical protein
MVVALWGWRRGREGRLGEEWWCRAGRNVERWRRTLADERGLVGRDERGAGWSWRATVGARQLGSGRQVPSNDRVAAMFWL